MTVNDHLDCFEPELVVIPCGSRKLDRRSPAGDLYVGSYHRACRRAAEALEPGRLLILSARYGLLDLDDVVEPYDTPHGAADSIRPTHSWSRRAGGVPFSGLPSWPSGAPGT
ncbi:hypothetical protein OOK06_20005 [Streptomyces sp. NBC_00340]|uniref:DUF6884 domain-containing protein n=1 Tax=Streptomyces sp. NBC_00340 TaxID=2975716 RepID=UPI002251953B|nr:DUF6884 domain-containing protein [Streptomyces sp. NBC_00340]MCX5134363.1 hypothetical protein [Streptomyces sp. NBC_00340]